MPVGPRQNKSKHRAPAPTNRKRRTTGAGYRKRKKSVRGATKAEGAVHEPLTSKDVTITDVRGEVEELTRLNRSLSDEDAFCLWFLRAYLTFNEHEAVSALCGTAHDKGIDAIWVDHGHSTVHLIQTKFRTGELGTQGEKRDDVLSIVEKARLVWGAKEALQKFYNGLDPAVSVRYRELVKYVRDKQYFLKLYFVTTGKVSQIVRNDATSAIRSIAADSKRPQVTIIDGHHIGRLYLDYTSGVAPAVPELSLRIQADHGSKIGHYLHRVDAATGIESWVFAMSAADVGELYTKAGVRLFARNIRGFLGSNKISSAMVDTLRTEPENFWYYNNGVTIVCDQVHASNTHLTLEAPQVINGQQTTRTLEGTGADSASILVKVIAVPRTHGNERYEKMVSSIVRATNWQNAIKTSDLVTNDRVQVALERELRGFNYQYLRKRQSKSEARAAMDNARMWQIKKEEFAQALAACDLNDSSTVFKGTEVLFGEQYYGKRIFRDINVKSYLPKYWLMQRVKSCARGYDERAPAKWIVLHSVWTRVKARIGKGEGERQFRYICEVKSGRALVELDKAINQAYLAALDFYQKKAGNGKKKLDRMAFFKQTGLDPQFDAFWRSSRRRKRFASALREFEKELPKTIVSD